MAGGYCLQLSSPLMRRSANLSRSGLWNKRQGSNLLLNSWDHRERPHWESNYSLNTLLGTLLEQLTTVNVKHVLGGFLDNEEIHRLGVTYVLVSRFVILILDVTVQRKKQSTSIHEFISAEIFERKISVTGCKCYPRGSEIPTCDIVTGQCRCKPNYVGLQCDNCQVNFILIS